MFVLIAMAANTASTASSNAEYNDIILVGRTGIGKSTTGNKLLGVDDEDQSVLKRFISTQGLLNEGCGEKRFIVSDGIQSTTAKCELISNEKSKIRVLDVPGFSAGSGAEVTEKAVSEGELSVLDIKIHSLVRIQKEMALNIRLVYFLPVRGVLEKAEIALQDELRVMTQFFGNDVFKNMVIVATLPPTKKWQELGFDEKDILKTKLVIEQTLRVVAGSHKIECPPIIHIGLYDKGEEIRQSIQTAKLKGDVIPLQSVCSKCNIIYSSTMSNNKCKETKCHPKFIKSKLARLLKFLSLGSDEEICTVCKRSRGTVGCCSVGITIDIGIDGNRTESVTVDHEYN